VISIGGQAQVVSDNCRRNRPVTQSMLSQLTAGQHPRPSGHVTGMSRPAGGPIHRSSRMAPDRCSVWLDEDIRIRRERSPIWPTGNWSDQPEMCADLVGNGDAHGPEASRWWHRGRKRAIMAVAESRPAVPAVLYDVNEAAEALRLSRSVLYELIRSSRLRTVKQGRRRLVPVSALAEYVDSLGRRT
jgi:excisionase family DNA binding protein